MRFELAPHDQRFVTPPPPLSVLKKRHGHTSADSNAPGAPFIDRRVVEAQPEASAAATVIRPTLVLSTDAGEQTDGPADAAAPRAPPIPSNTPHLSSEMDGLPPAPLLPGGGSHHSGVGWFERRGLRGPGRLLRNVFARECASTCIFTFGGRVITHSLPTYSLAPLPLTSEDVYWFVFLAALLWFDVGTVWNPAGAVGSLCKARDTSLDAFVQSSGGPLRHALGRGAACCAGGVLGCCAFAQLVTNVYCHIPNWTVIETLAPRVSVVSAAAHECALTFGLFMFIYVTRELGGAVSALLTAWCVLTLGLLRPDAV